MGYNNRQYQRTFLGNPSAAVGSLGSTAQLFTGSGTLHGIIVGTTSGTAFGVFDTITQSSWRVSDNSTTILLKASIAEGNYVDIDAAIANGLYVSFAINGTYTVLWSQG